MGFFGNAKKRAGQAGKVADTIVDKKLRAAQAAAEKEPMEVTFARDAERRRADVAAALSLVATFEANMEGIKRAYRAAKAELEATLEDQQIAYNAGEVELAESFQDQIDQLELTVNAQLEAAAALDSRIDKAKIECNRLTREATRVGAEQKRKLNETKMAEIIIKSEEQANGINQTGESEVLQRNLRLADERHEEAVTRAEGLRKVSEDTSLLKLNSGNNVQRNRDELRRRIGPSNLEKRMEESRLRLSGTGVLDESTTRKLAIGSASKPVEEVVDLPGKTAPDKGTKTSRAPRKTADAAAPEHSGPGA